MALWGFEPPGAATGRGGTVAAAADAPNVTAAEALGARNEKPFVGMVNANGMRGAAADVAAVGAKLATVVDCIQPLLAERPNPILTQTICEKAEQANDSG